jgi:Mg-chelatase subunit ChlD
VNSVRVFGDRSSGSISGSVNLYFAKFFGVADFEPRQVAVGTFMQRNIVLVLDRSGSMKFNEAGDRIYGDGYGPESKITKVKQSLNSFMSFLTGTGTAETIGVVSFSNDAVIDVGLTTNLTDVQNAYNALVPDGRTGIALGIDRAVQLIHGYPQSQFVENTIVVLTDGQENIGRDGVDYGDGAVNQVPVSVGAPTAALDAAAQGISVCAITYCIDSAKGKDTMIDVANNGRGKYYDAVGQADLNQAFMDIAYTVSAMLTQ